MSFILSFLFLTRVLSLKKSQKEIMWSCFQFAKSVTVIRQSKFLMKVLNCKVSFDRSLSYFNVYSSPNRLIVKSIFAIHSDVFFL